jgi:ubiquinone/menaquinone biosynthesis C-methylase UbiE
VQQQESHPSDDQTAYDALRPLMLQFGATCTPREFYWAVNRAYHTVESQQYDSLHADMFQGLGPVWQRLTQWLPAEPAKLSVLDIGSGTGLVAEFLNRVCPARIGKITALDPCQAMLDQQRAKKSRWSFEVDWVLGDTSVLPAAAVFDVVTVNSVLHHIVELPAFCARMSGLLKPGGVLLTAQDAPATSASDPVLSSRLAEAQRKRKLRRLSPFRIGRNLGVIWRMVFGDTEARLLEGGTNDPLLKQGIITHPMDVMSIWTVTDFQIGRLGNGILIEDLKTWLRPVHPLEVFAYQFWGVPWMHLDEAEKRQEQAWFEANDPHGGRFASAWQRPR